MNPPIPTDKKQLAKASTGISGFDAITFGGLPAGRPTLVCGAAGCGKTLFGMTFLVNGAMEFDEPGVLMSFEEKGEDLAKNVESLGYNIATLIADQKILIDYVRIERSEIEETGEYDLEGLFVRLDYAIKKIGAKRVVLDTIEALFGGLSNLSILRAELRRLFEWLKDRNITAVITGERGDGQLTRYGLEEYISDCVILLDNRVDDQITTRRIRVVKYRGSAHGTNEYPFLIDGQGISVLPITSADLAHHTSSEVVYTGVQELDDMLGAGGFFKGSSVLLSGTAGTGKSILAASFADSICQRGERCILFSFEEGSSQIIRNMHSIGMDLQQHLDSGLLRIESSRPSFYGFEMHLTLMNREIERFNPSAVIIDPISALRGPENEVHATLLRLVDILKSKGITGMMTNLTSQDIRSESGRNLSSLMDTWLHLVNLESNGERNRGLYILKSRGMSHSNQISEFLITNSGIDLRPAYLGPEGMFTGSARLAQEAKEKAQTLAQKQAEERRILEIKSKRITLERQLAEIQAALASEDLNLKEVVEQSALRESVSEEDRKAMAVSRGASK